jgi:hypothetical protein
MYFVDYIEDVLGELLGVSMEVSAGTADLVRRGKEQSPSVIYVYSS